MPRLPNGHSNQHCCGAPGKADGLPSTMLLFGTIKTPIGVQIELENESNLSFLYQDYSVLVCLGCRYRKKCIDNLTALWCCAIFVPWYVSYDDWSLNVASYYANIKDDHCEHYLPTLNIPYRLPDISYIRGRNSPRFVLRFRCSSKGDDERHMYLV